jgi:diamine N-acetyltransferase
VRSDGDSGDGAGGSTEAVEAAGAAATAPDQDIRKLGTTEELRACVSLLRASFGTVAREFGLTEENAPTNAAFTTLENLQRHIEDGMEIHGMLRAGVLAGCVAIKRAKSRNGVYLVERLAVLPGFRHRGFGASLLSYALGRIQENGGTAASIGLIDENRRLKEWYQSKGFIQQECRRVAHLPFKVCFMTLDLRGITAFLRAEKTP